MPPVSSGDRRPFGLRPAEAGDLARLVALEREAFGGDGYDLDALQALMASRARRDPPTDLRVALDGAGRIVGLAIGQVFGVEAFCERYGLDAGALRRSLPVGPPVGYVKSMAVCASMRGRGIGRQLTAARDAYFLSEHAGLLLLWQMPRPGLAEFHGALGYRPLPLTSSIRYADGSQPTLWWRLLER